MYVAALAITIWIAGAIFFDVGNASILGGALATLWMAVVTASFVWSQPLWKPFLILLLVGVCFLWWWLSQRPSHERSWHPHFSVLPLATLHEDVITIHNMRNTGCDHVTVELPRYETRRFHLSKLCGIDALIAYWGSPWMCHPMFVFDFGSDGRVCFSIEVRYRIGQKYDFIRSIYRQQELICVVCDERDAILRRTKDSEQDVYLYRLHLDEFSTRTFFLDYIDTINSIAADARWYHGLTNNCTTSIYLQSRSHMRWDWRMLFNGKVDQLLYDRKLIDQDLPYAELKRQSKVNDIANSTRAENFGDTIRRGLPGYRQRENLDRDDAALAGSHEI